MLGGSMLFLNTMDDNRSARISSSSFDIWVPIVFLLV
jgi:hypothetical protein